MIIFFYVFLLEDMLLKCVIERLPVACDDKNKNQKCTDSNV
jgi:hypothetical protein